MFPSLLADETKGAVTEYLTTTFALADDDVRATLEDFLLHPDRGIFQGPYLRVRTPYRPVDEAWRSPLSWLPPGFTPYRHQARAFERLSTLSGSSGVKAAEPTIVTTGTGSGKTESFILPLLDHAKRARERGEGGIKAILLYPMNALVTDQAARIARLLHTEAQLAGVTAGVYIGGSGTLTQSTPTQLADNRDALRANPPDLLLTNYKMLDLLLLRPADRPLWEASRSSLQFVVLDEFHTYDGAQGTDVAMLLRRLGATVKVAQPGRPLGRITPVATSATLGGGTRSDELRTFAETIFGALFPPEALVTEERLTADEVVADIDYEAGVPDAERLALEDEHHDAELGGSLDADHPEGWQRLAAAALGNDVPEDTVALGRILSRNFLTRAVLQVLSDRPRTPAEAVEELARSGVLQWGASRARDPERTERALLRFLALLSAARLQAPAGGTRPLVNLEAQLWVRELSRMLRSVRATDADFAWWHDGVPDGEETWLPAVHCRACGHSGWMAVAPEVGGSLVGAPRQVWQSSATYPSRAKTRTLIRTDTDDPAAQWLDPRSLTLTTKPPAQEPEPGAEHLPQALQGADLVPVLVTPSEEAAQEQRCPSCGANDAIRFLGSSVATLASVALTSQFGSHLVPSAEKKTLVFTDSVQDAAHRAAFIEGRAFAFNLRSAIIVSLRGEATAVDVVAQRLGELDEAERYAVAPPDFVRRLGLEAEWLRGRAGRRAAQLLESRLGLQAQLEVGLSSRLGRTLELTGSVAVDVDIDLTPYAGLARETHANLPQLALAELPEQAAYERWLLGLLDRLRTQGGIVHPWLLAYMRDDGKRWSIWGGSPPGMQKFPRGRPAPAYWTTGRDPGLDSLAPQGESWLTSWTSRCLEVSAAEAKAMLPVVASLLAREDGPLVAVTSKKGNTVYGLDPTRVVLHPVVDEALASGSATLRCEACDHVQPVAQGRLETWLESVCPRLRCTGRLRPEPQRTDNFYRRLYLAARVRRIVTHEHTGLLDRAVREDVERRFKSGASPVDPNILTCTPTLELGIDIGDLSTVTLSSLPRATANYLQRVGRAGRSTGNAFVLATVPSRARDLYYFADPLALIDGDVLPPGAYLNATEILQRQYLAFCLDRVADGSLDIGPVPNLLGGVLGKHLEEGEWLRTFVDLVTEQSAALADDFLGLYGDQLDPLAGDALRAYAREGLRLAIARVATEWLERRKALDERIVDLADSVTELEKAGHRDHEQEEDLRRWKGELGALRASRTAMGRTEAFTGLVELGLLPNYFLLDEATTLDVQLWWTTEDGADDQGSRFRNVEHTIDRGSRAALTELAPGASFYVFGSRIKIDAVDLGPSGRPSWAMLRLCPDCGHGAEQQQAAGPCPMCGSARYADAGSRHALLPMRRVSAVQHRDDAVLDDDNEERVRTRFTVVTGVSVAPQDVVRAWRLADVTFGAEYVRNATIRSVNVGKSDQLGGGQAVIAGQTLNAPGFLTCTTCGVVAEDTDLERVKHRGWCARRRGQAEWQRLFLSHELNTQAVRMLLPMSTLHVEERLASFSAALQLGLRMDFGGDPQHLSITTASMPDEERRPRQFVVLHDLVPGGTGYLDRFGQPERLRAILVRARDFLAGCTCRLEGRRSCHRCLLGVAPPRHVDVVDRELALELLDDLLDDWQPVEIASVTDIDISLVELSELEDRFRELLKRWVATREADGHTYAVQLGPSGEELDLRLRVGDDVRRWRVRQQKDVQENIWTRPDLMITRQDAQDAQIAIYLDGRRYHASTEHNRTADDARKRDELRAAGYRVWAITWDDVVAFERALDGRPDDVEPYVSPGVFAAVGEAVPDPRARGCLANPIGFLLDHLLDPGSDVWGRVAEETLLSVLSGGNGGAVPALVPTTHAGAHQALLSLARGEAPVDVGAAQVMIAPRHGTTGLPLFVVGEMSGDGRSALGVLAMLDDSESVVGGPDHERRWREWLRWANLMQFLTRPAHGEHHVRRMAAIWTSASLDWFEQELLPIATAGPPAVGRIRMDAMSTGWQLALEYADPAVHQIAAHLAAAEVPAPEVGIEVGQGEWQVEFGWEDHRLAVVIDVDAARDAWLVEQGWTVLRPGDQSEGSLVEAVLRALKEAPA